ncbi:MAG: hypothetical protein PVF70_14060, partial [Anaerolineales bacterium]
MYHRGASGGAAHAGIGPDPAPLEDQAAIGGWPDLNGVRGLGLVPLAGQSDCEVGVGRRSLLGQVS